MSSFANSSEKPSIPHTIRSEEELHWFDVMRTFLLYGDFLDMELERRQRHINSLNNFQQSKLPKVTFDRFGHAQIALQRNVMFLEDLVSFYQRTTQDWADRAGKKFETQCLPNPYDGPNISRSQQHRCEAVLHSFAREWSVNGTEERALTFDPIVAELEYRLPVNAENAYVQRVLVPGCGLARLPIDISSKGYSVEANEYSAYMLMASNFILNGNAKTNEFEINPYIQNVCNVFSPDDVNNPISIPDAAACDIINSCKYSKSTNDQDHNLPFPRFSMSAGDFVEIYGPQPQDQGAGQGLTDTAAASGSNSIINSKAFDAVVTCFFIDTAPVVMDYLATMHHCIRPGGIWVNFGPLLYHWMSDSEGNGDERFNASIELSWEELQLVIESMGFELLTHRGFRSNADNETDAKQNSYDNDQTAFSNDGKVKKVDVPYTRNRGSLMWTQYTGLFFTARRL